ncbi:hypothetical protein P43SY_004919 [Pythium insidiosum]|uniref:Transcription elongation factor SPT5 n=1 Tax=Pythium insidiosum TaxID=114742 RepID=A0AAD5LPL3_PYTIN|nr:hypothetical protein P43SY_004919 [Pythium insidiosum]
MSSSDEEIDRNLSEEEEVSEDEVPEEEEEEDDDDIDEEDEDDSASKRKKRKGGGADAKAKPKKKRRSAVSKFIEEEADVDDDEEEEEDDEDGDYYRSERVLAEEAETSQQYRYEPQNRSHFDDDETAEDIVNRIKKRHQQSRRHYDDDEEGGDMVQSEVAQQSLLPSIQDPRMWVFKCKPGREQHLVIALMNKFLDFARRGEPLHIKSVVASSSKGFIYVEAEREPHAKDAVNGLRDIMQYSMKLVPVHEMTSVLNVKKKRKPVVAGTWARFKRAGLYKGDLCKVLEILDNGSRATVKMVPRIDPAVLGGGEPQKYKKGQRPPQKLFNAQLTHHDGRRRHPTTGEMMDFFENDYYKDGFLIKEVNIATMLQTEEVNPTLDEINKFSSAVGDSGGDDIAAPVDADDWKNRVDLTKGDTVRVIEGDLINLMGVVVSTNTANDTVRVMPLHEEIKDTILDFQMKQLMKYVKVGDHIKVVSGRYSGETGTVVAVDDTDGAPIAIVLVDSMAKEIQVRVRDLQESAEVSHGLDSYKGKELYDMVALAHGDVGVITHVGREGFKVLCQNGQARNISDQEIQRKLVSSRAVALDQKHNHVSVGEMVGVVDGPFAGHSGTVKHIYRTYLFLHNNRIMTNAGIFVARARQVILSGSKARSDMIQNSTIAGADGRPTRAGMPPRNDRRNESDMIGKTVKIKKGQWKGYIGIVVEETEQKVKVEIHCKAKVVDVDRLHVALAGTRQGVIQDKPRYANTPMNGATPLPSQTPLHATPGMSHDHGGLEPMTPGFNPTTPGLSAMTPGLNPVTPGINTPGYHHNPMTPGFGVATPGLRMNSAVTPAATPGMPGSSVPMTPAFHHDVDDFGGSGGSGEVTWKTKGVEVEVVSGDHRGRIGVISSVNGSSCTLDCDGQFITIALDDVQPTVPEKQDTVIILSGDEAGQTGSLIGVDGTDGIVKVDGGSEIKIYAIASLAKLAQ